MDKGKCGDAGSCEEYKGIKSPKDEKLIGKVKKTNTRHEFIYNSYMQKIFKELKLETENMR